MRKYLLTAILALFLNGLNAQIPPAYYDTANGLWGDSLKNALHFVIDGHQVQSYSSLWQHFQKTDVDSNGYVWDIYSSVPGGTPAYQYTFVTHQCGNYSTEGDCYNREHSFPKSWFSSASPMQTDLFHLYPTDGYVNGRRSNYPYGEVNNATWTSTNGSKVGPCSYPGYTSVVFEPIDEYKGDLARTYFYMMTRYKDQISSWTSPMLQGDSLAPWAKALLLDWAANDTVSLKEISRNDSIYTIQGNRNPFIDHPEYILYIWGGQKPPVSNIQEVIPNDYKVWHTGSSVQITGLNTNSIIHIYDLNGRILHSESTSLNSTSIPFNYKGIFLVRITNNSSSEVFKLMSNN